MLKFETRKGGRWGATQRVLPNLLVALVSGELKGLLSMHASVVETGMVKLPGF